MVREKCLIRDKGDDPFKLKKWLVQFLPNQIAELYNVENRKKARRRHNVSRT